MVRAVFNKGWHGGCVLLHKKAILKIVSGLFVGGGVKVVMVGVVEWG